MTIDNRSTNQNYKLPNPQNLLVDDAQRLIEAIQAIDADVFDRYTKAEVDQAIADLIDGAPATLDTLKEISDAINSDSSYFTTINNALATKANLSGGNTFSGDQDFGATVTVDKLTIDNGDVYMSNGALVFNDAGGAHSDRTGSNIDHIHHIDDGNDANTGYNFVSDGTFRQAGNADLIATNYLPGTDNSGNVGLSTRKFADGHFHDFQVDNVLSVRAAISLADNDELRFGTGNDGKLYHNGSHLYLDLNNDDDFHIRDANSSNVSRFFFDVSAGDFEAAHHMRAGRIGSTYTSGVHGTYNYGRNGSAATDTYTAYAMIAGDYRGERNNATNEETAMFYAYMRMNDGTGGTPMHNMDVMGRYWSWSSQYAGRGSISTTGSASRPYRTGEHAMNCYAGSGNVTFICGRSSADNDFVFQADVGTPKIEFRANGNGYFDGGADLGNADYAEMFEWADGNPNAEDRRGYAVCLDGEKIRFATSDDPAEDILGIVSAEPGVLGDAATLNWQGMHLKDEFGRKITEPVEYLVWNIKGEPKPDPGNHRFTADHRIAVSELGTGSDADLAVPEYAKEDDIRRTYQQLVENPDYDPERPYTARFERQEWDAIGMLGKLALRKGQPVGDRWRKLKDINETLELWLVR